MKAKVIKTDAEYAECLARIEKLMDAKAGTARGDELELLSLLVHTYEEERFPIDHPDPITAIRFRMEQQGLRPKDLAPILGSRSKVSEVLSGRRSLRLKMIQGLATHLGIPASVLLSKPKAA
jgi:HTH-type transcriptional regulator/antitoxin HigA